MSLKLSGRFVTLLCDSFYIEVATVAYLKVDVLVALLGVPSDELATYFFQSNCSKLLCCSLPLATYFLTKHANDSRKGWEYISSVALGTLAIFVTLMFG